MSIKGKTSDQNTDPDVRYTTVQPIGSRKVGLDVLPKALFPIQILPFNPEAGSTETTIVLTGHTAREGDVLRFTSGANRNMEATVSSVTANEIILGTKLLGVPLVADTFLIMRHITLTIDESGALSTTSGPIQYVLDGANQQVIEDTADPTNNRALPTEAFLTVDGVQVPLNIDTAVAANNVVLPSGLYMMKDGENVPVSKDTAVSANTQPIPVELVAADGTETSFTITVNGAEVNVQLNHNPAVGSADSVLVGTAGAARYLTIDTDDDVQTKDRNLNTAIGAQADAVATSDTGTFSFISLFKRSLERLTGLLDKYKTRDSALAATGDLMPIAGTDGTVYKALKTDSTGKLEVINSGLDPAILGRKAAAISQSMVISTEDFAELTAIKTAVETLDNIVNGSNQASSSIDNIDASYLGRQAEALGQSVTLSTEDKADLAAIRTSVELMDDVVNGSSQNATSLDNIDATYLGRQAEALGQTVTLSTEDKAALDSIASAAEAGLVPIQQVVVNMAVNNIPNGSRYVAIADIGAVAAKKIHIFMQTGEPVWVSQGSTRKLVVPSGGMPTSFEIDLVANSSLELEAYNTVITSGLMTINLWG